MISVLLWSVAIAVLLSQTHGYPSYQSKIPNGNIVPNPCNMSATWAGVGHQASQGAGPRNPFGLDFAAYGHVWNKTICQIDSDGDGRTNGQELGDPNCTWTEGSTPALSRNLSHPGICEPITSPNCMSKNSWLMNCNAGSFICPAINDSNVKNYTMRFPVTPVPAVETTYICYRFTLPSDNVYDIIAIEPVLDNKEILHHMLLYACTNEPTDSPANGTYMCGMGGGQMSCLSLIGVWGVGVSGDCLNKKLGFRIGSTGFQYAILQLHWNNPMKKTGLTDSSGMRIYYTSQLRPNAGEVLSAGQAYLEIPPGKSDVSFSGSCSPACTKKWPNSIFLTNAMIHMHFLGKSGHIDLYRNGNLVMTLDNSPNYDYNLPTVTRFDDPVEMKPGDEIRVNCVYDSTGKNTTTYYGEATSDEMCFGFFAYYPRLTDVEFCTQWKDVSWCGMRDVYVQSCDFKTFWNLVFTLDYLCQKSCSDGGCAVALDGMYATGCQNYPDVNKFLHTFAGNAANIYDRCSSERPPKPTKPNQCSNQSPVNAPFSLAVFIWSLAAFLVQSV